VGSYVYQPDERITFVDGVQALRSQGRRVISKPVDITIPSVIDRVRELGLGSGMIFKDFDIDIQAFRSYYEIAGYLHDYAAYYPGNQQEKALEHYVALQLLNLKRGDVFVDLASEHSPVPEIYGRLTGAETYSQDIMYPEGINGRRIGGDACAMPVADGFASAASLTCSLEHFEEDADVRLFLELARVLQPGGAVCVAPFYVNVEHAIQTDPTVGVPAHVAFDPGAPVYCVEGWGNRHARFYSPESFMDRVVSRVGDRLTFDFYYLRNASAIDSVYARFAFIATRRSQEASMPSPGPRISQAYHNDAEGRW
jgi:hypothetical protein